MCHKIWSKLFAAREEVRKLVNDILKYSHLVYACFRLAQIAAGRLDRQLKDGRRGSIPKALLDFWDRQTAVRHTL